MNLWTVGCADPRLTAPARSPMDKPGKTLRVSPTLPTGRRLPTSFTSVGSHQSSTRSLSPIRIPPIPYRGYESGIDRRTSRSPDAGELTEDGFLSAGCVIVRHGR